MPAQDAFCTHCGAHFSGHRPSLAHWFHEFVEHTLAWDGRLAKSIWSSFRRPGEMAVAFLAGRRDAYSRPLGLFLFVALCSLLVFDHSVQFRLESRLADLQQNRPEVYQRWLNAPRPKFTAHPEWPAFMNERLKRIGDRFEAMPAKQAFLEGTYSRVRTGYLFTLLYLPVMAFLLKLAFWRRKKYVGEHLVVTTYFYCAAFPLLLVTAFVSMTAVPGAGYITHGVIGAYWLILLDTLNRVYGGRRWANFLRSMVLVAIITYVLPMVALWLGPVFYAIKG